MKIIKINFVRNVSLIGPQTAEFTVAIKAETKIHTSRPILIPKNFAANTNVITDIPVLSKRNPNK